MTALALLAQPGEKGISAVLDTSVDHIVKERREGLAHLGPWGNAQRVHHVSPANRQAAPRESSAERTRSNASSSTACCA